YYNKLNLLITKYDAKISSLSTDILHSLVDGADLFKSDSTRNVYRDETNYKLYKRSKEFSHSISEALFNYGFKPSTADLLSTLFNYEESSVKALEQALSLGADPNGTTVEAVFLSGSGIHFDSITHPQDTTTHVPLIAT